MDNWLVKFASTQPTSEHQFKQQLNTLPLDELRDLIGNPTSNIDSFQEKAASVIRQGRQLAHTHGQELLEKSANDTQVDRALVNAVSELSDEEAIKLAEMLQAGTDVEKVAGIMGMAGKALKGLGGMAAKSPHATAAVGGAAIGAAAGGPDNRLGGAMAGAGLGAAGSKMIPGMAGKIQRGGFAAGLQGQKMMMPKMAEVENLYKRAMSAYKCSSSMDMDGGGTNWLNQFEGSPLLEQAFGLAQQEIQVEIQDIQKRQAQSAMMRDDDTWTQRDVIRARKNLLELQLVAQRNGLGGGQPPQEAQAQDQSQPAPQTQQQPQQQGVGGPGGVQMPMGGDQGQQKQASLVSGARAAGNAVGSIGRRLAPSMGVTGQTAVSGGVLGAGIGALKGAVSAPAQGESRLSNMAHGALKGGVIGGAAGGVIGAGAKAGNQLARQGVKLASLPFVARR